MHVADDTPCIVGDEVVVGHRAMLHACRVEDGCLIGMQSTILDEAVIGHGSVVGAGALVTQRTVIPPYSLVLGSPGARGAHADRRRTRPSTAPLALKYVRLKENYLRDSPLGVALISTGICLRRSWSRFAMAGARLPRMEISPIRERIVKLESRLEILRGHL